MTRILTIAAIIIAAVAGLRAQSDEELMQQAMERYKSVTTLTAPVTVVRHNTLLAADQKSTGMFYFKKPSSILITTDGGKDRLLMHDGKFTMVTDGKATTMTGKNEQLEALKTMLQSFTSGEGTGDVALDDLADVDAERNGTKVTLTITPRVSDPKARRKMLYRSFVVTLDTKAGALQSIRLNERGENYTQYDFGRFTADAPVDDKVFAL